MKTTITLISLSALLACLTLLTQSPQTPASGGLADRFEQLDRDGDEKLTADELPRAELLQRLDANKDGVVTPEEAKALTMRRRPAAPEAPDKPSPTTTGGAGILKRLDLRYAETPGVDAKFQTLDVYTTPAAKARPVFVFVHGGSWKQGDKAQAEPMAAPIVARGYVLASANHRLLPDSQFPANAEDVAAAVAWLRQHAAEFGGDARRIFLGGHLAGAHLAALVGTDARYLAKHGLKLDALSGVLALDTLMNDVMNYAQTPVGKQSSVEVFGQDPSHFGGLVGAQEGQRFTTLFAYNEMTPAVHPDTGERVLLIAGGIMPGLTGDDARAKCAWYLVRHADGRYGTGQVFDPAVVRTAVGGLRSARTVCVSPFPEDQGRVLYFGGFDAAQGPHRDTAWIYKGTLKEKR